MEDSTHTAPTNTARSGGWGGLWGEGDPLRIKRCRHSPAGHLSGAGVSLNICPSEPQEDLHFLLFSHSVVSNSVWPYGLQHARLPRPSLFPGVCSNSCPLSRWCHPTISSSVIPFSLWPQSFPASGSFPVSQLFALGVQSIGASASASVLPMNIQSWFPLRLTGLISLLKQKIYIYIYFFFLILKCLKTSEKLKE